jgi:hypothetical protein
MISTEIVNQVAQIMRQKASLKDAKNQDSLKHIEVQRDEVELSPKGEAYIANDSKAPDYEKEQGMMVERLKSLVTSGNYRMSDDMVQEIASRIAKMFM